MQSQLLEIQSENNNTSNKYILKITLVKPFIKKNWVHIKFKYRFPRNAIGFFQCNPVELVNCDS